MKLGELRGMIRKTKGAPLIITTLGGVTMTLSLMKTPLLEELERAFPGGKAAETNLNFDEATGVISDGSTPLTIARHIDLGEDATSEDVANAFAGLRSGSTAFTPTMDLDDDLDLDADDELDLDDDDLDL